MFGYSFIPLQNKWNHYLRTVKKLSENVMVLQKHCYNKCTNKSDWSSSKLDILFVWMIIDVFASFNLIIKDDVIVLRHSNYLSLIWTKVENSTESKEHVCSGWRLHVASRVFIRLYFATRLRPCFFLIPHIYKRSLKASKPDILAKLNDDLMS